MAHGLPGESVAAGLEGAPAGSKRQGILTAYREAWGVLVTAEGDGPGGHNTLLAFHPQSGIIVVAMTNSFGLGDEARFLVEGIAGRVVQEAGRRETPPAR